MINSEGLPEITPQEIEKTLTGIKEIGENRRFQEENLPLLKTLYPNHWVAISNGKVIASTEYEVLWQLLDENEIDIRSSLVTFLNSEPETLIL